MKDRPVQNILVLSHEFPPFGGGGGRILSMLCEELHVRGVHSTVLTAAPPRHIRRQFPFTVIYFPTFRKAIFKTSVSAILLYMLQVLLYAFAGRLRGYDLLFSNMSIPAGFVGIVVARVLKLSHAVWYHGAEVTQNRSQGAGVLFRTACLFVARRASANFFISQGLMDLAKSYGTISAAALLPNATRAIEQPPIPFTQGRKLFLFAARMEAVKNPLLLVAAVRLLRERNRLTGMVFQFAGSGRLFAKVRREIGRYALEPFMPLEPVLPPERMAELLQTSYAVVLPSVIEGYPTAILEAGTYGVPAVGSDTIGNRDAISHEKTGLLFALNDAHDFARAIERLADDPELRNRLGKGAWERSRLYTIQRTADCFLQGIGQMVRSGS